MEAKLKCPQCNGDGWFADTGTATDAQGLPEPIQIQVQCAFCEGSGSVTDPSTIKGVVSDQSPEHEGSRAKNEENE